ncbi:MAG: galactose-1-phosphate uridylyltransferase [bacterium]|nr:galactose-1-phosphate uridylyltransferase [bacterium]
MSEMRRDPLTKRWILCGSEYGIRQVTSFYNNEETNGQDPAETEKLCPLCQGNEYMTPPEIYAVRDEKSKWKVRVVPHRFPILKIEGNLDLEGFGPYDMMNPIGAHEVVIETPRHFDVIGNDQQYLVFKAIKDRTIDLMGDMRFKYIMIYKNKGKSAGSILSHPHAQIIALPFIPNEVANKLHTAQQYYDQKERCIYCDLLKFEQKAGERMVYSNKHFIAITPYASRFPFEIMIMPVKHNCNFISVTDEELKSLAEIITVLREKLRKALSTSNARYALYNSPVRFAKKGYWTTLESDYHWHIEFVPIITREIGFEWASDFFVNPTIPEEAARYLRDI